MKFGAAAAACLSLLSHVLADAAGSTSSSFTPPQVFQQVNLVRTISLEKNYAKETINVIIQNTSEQPQDEYYVPFTSEKIERVGGFEVRDKKDETVTGFVVDALELDISSDTQYYRIKLPSQLAPDAQKTLSITFYHLHAFKPLPASIEQNDKQYLSYSFSAYSPSAYPSLKQKTEVKLPTTDIPEYTTVAASSDHGEFPKKEGQKLTYGPFSKVEANVISPAKIRYQFTNPISYVSELKRDIEVSHWGGNVAFEENYNLLNQGANLSSLFSRVEWSRAIYYKPETTALRELKFPLQVGSKDAYFTDVIGNVSTSRFRSNRKEAVLEIKPRYPVFGGWKYPFTIGWNADARRFLKKATGDTFVLKVPFLEGPKQSEGIQYEQTQVRVLLPEGAENVKFHTTIPESSITEHAVDLQKTYLDTVGRTVLTIRARNLVDDFQGRELVVSYEYPVLAGLRKPLVVFSAMVSVFVGIWAFSKVEFGFSPTK